MALSNKYGSILLATGNKSELFVGYCTIYGDLAGGLAPISDLPKTLVYRIAEWLNSTSGRGIIPPSIITKPPSAELRPGQTDQDSLPPYPVLDEILKRYIDEHQSRVDLLAAGFAETVVDQVISLVGKAEFKRLQAPLGLKVFLTALAIADDLGAVAVIAIFYTESINVVALLVAAVLLGALFAGIRARARRGILYLLIIGVWRFEFD